MQGHPRQTRHREEFGQNVVCWRRGWQTTAVFLLQEPHDYEQYGKAKRHNTRRWAPLPSPGQKVSNMLLGKSLGQLPIAPERMRWLGTSLWKQCSVADVSAGESKIWRCKEQYCIGIWNVKTMNQGKLELAKQEMARANMDIFGISEIKWTGMGKFNPDDH